MRRGRCVAVMVLIVICNMVVVPIDMGTGPTKAEFAVLGELMLLVLYWNTAYFGRDLSMILL